MPPPVHARFASPSSSIDPWNGTNSALSPAADTESYLDSCPTPPDTAVLPPSFFHSTSLDQWQDTTSPIHFFGMGPVSNDGACVNPVEVDPSQQLGYCEPEGSSMDFNLTSESGFGTDSYSMPSPIIAVQAKAFLGPEELSPAVEDEAEAAQYPPPQSRGVCEDEDEGDDASDAAVGEAHTKRKIDSDDDDDYVPGKKSIVSAGSRKTRPKQPSGGRSTKKNPNKKPKVLSSGAQSSAIAASQPRAAKPSFPCPNCDQASFKDASSLKSHIKKNHTRPFTCVFHFAGCPLTFPNKNEWKRHVMTKHILLHYWVCTEGECGVAARGGADGAAPGTRRRPRGPASEGPSNLGTLPKTAFNRKDLFTSHIRRMHRAPQDDKPGRQGHKRTANNNNNNNNNESKRLLEQSEHERQRDSCRQRCDLPQHMACPVAQCGTQFQGAGAWDERMEHVALHLDKAAQGVEPAVTFGGAGDPTLLEWAAAPGVDIVRRVHGAWVLNGLRVGGPDVDAEARSEASGAVDVDYKEEEQEDEEEEEVRGEIVVDHRWNPDEDAEGEEYDE